jgi:hypothetical protein
MPQRPRPLAEIPVNREVKYDVPKPAVPLEKLELLPEFREKSELNVSQLHSC